ncbi:MAG TPA: cupin domain-containing protein [Candidatus Elarobacter sp.]|jgi:gentisate 1,2-dioxygenase|nr:cupin domain-containing protein [Candidatus Elarobacter sp.]
MIATDSLDRLFSDAAAQDAQPLWTMMDTVVPPHPEPKAVPHVWRYAAMRPLLERAGSLVSAREAERRVLQLINPALRPPHTTDTLYAGLQLILPGEVARAHRHVAFALRFIVEGSAAYTAVGGEKVTMRRGDLILTPSWEYHDHGHEGDEPMVWLDGLDLPVYQFFPANFAQPYAEERFPSEPAPADSHLRYPWDDMQARLEADPGPYSYAEYAHRQTGGAISRVIGAAAERIARGSSSPTRRETAGVVYHVYRGRGTTTVGGEQLQWEKGDTFCIPSWLPYRHEAHKDTYLFRFDDRPVLDAIGAYRREASAS